MTSYKIVIKRAGKPNIRLSYSDTNSITFDSMNLEAAKVISLIDVIKKSAELIVSEAWTSIEVEKE